MTVSQATKFLEDAFDVLNKAYFESALPKAAITIQSSQKAYGHYTVDEVWKSGKKTMLHEINLGAEWLGRPVCDTIGTLIHEMVHFFCAVNDIQDTSRGGTYHNKRFKLEAEKRGLCIDYNEKNGWSITQPTKELRSFVSAQHWNGKLNISRDASDIGGKEPKSTKKVSSTRKYSCPCCGMSVRATRIVHISCMDCNVPLQPQE